MEFDIRLWFLISGDVLRDNNTTFQDKFDGWKPKKPGECITEQGVVLVQYRD